MYTWIKICGLASKNDIDICIENNVDAIGFLIQKELNIAQNDILEVSIAKELIDYASTTIETCLLIHLTNVKDILEIVKELKPSMLQIQKKSHLQIENLQEIKRKFPKIKISRTFNISKNIQSSDILNDIRKHIDCKCIDYVLLDSSKGGSGEVHNWEISASIVQEIKPFPVILAGGLNPDNIDTAVKKVKPFGVDAMSGVSIEPGLKDKTKIKQLCSKIREN